MDLFPLSGFYSAVPSLQLHQVFGGIPKQVPPNDATSRLVGLGTDAGTVSKTRFKLRALSFRFVPNDTAGRLWGLNCAVNARFET